MSAATRRAPPTIFRAAEVPGNGYRTAAMSATRTATTAGPGRKPACAQCHRAPAAPAAAKVAWREPDDEPEVTMDRDSRLVRFASSKGALREQMVPRTPGSGRNIVSGGGMRRMVATNIAPSREDVARFVSVPGRYVPIGFARYVSPVIRPTDYEYYRISGWQVAVPRSIPGERVRDLLYRIYHYGPQSAGYVAMGDTLVPAILGPGDRQILAGTAIEYEPNPLSP
jgi:hypothetical protein